MRDFWRQQHLKFFKNLQKNTKKMFTLQRMIVRKVLMSSNKKLTVTFLGLDSSGKTSIFNDFKRHEKLEISALVPTTGKNVLNIKYKKKGIEIMLQDVGGAEGFRKYWYNYFKETDIIVYVIDATASEERMKLNRIELENIAQHADLKHVSVLVCLNKMDKLADTTLQPAPLVKNAEELKQYLNLNSIFDNNNNIALWRVMETCAGSKIEEEFIERKRRERKQTFIAQTKEQITQEDDEKSRFPIETHFGITGIFTFVEDSHRNGKVKARAAKNKKR